MAICPECHMDKPLASPRCPNCNQDIGFINTLLAQIIYLSSVLFFSIVIFGGIYWLYKTFIA